MRRDELPTNPATPSVLQQRIRLGVDVWHGINPQKLDWTKLRETHSFVLIRMCYGASPDRLCVEHTNRARAAGFSLGAWMFFRPTQTVEKQVEVFAKQARACGVGTGWIVPALDIEDDTPKGTPQVPVAPNWAGPIRRILSAWHNCYGARPLVYCSHRDWTRLDSPAWLLEYHQWTPHWDAKRPRVPGDVGWTIWQNTGKPMPGIYDTRIAQDVARGPLPRIPTITPRGRRRVEGVRNITIDDAVRNR